MYYRTLVYKSSLYNRMEHYNVGSFYGSSNFFPMFGVGSNPHPFSFLLHPFYPNTLFTYIFRKPVDPFECFCDLISPRPPPFLGVKI